MKHGKKAARPGRVELKAGSTLWFDGQKQRVLAMGAQTVMLQSLASRERTSIRMEDLLSADDFSMDEDGLRWNSAPEASGGAVPEGVPKPALDVAQKLLRHVLEMSTGFQSGTRAEMLPGEPRASFDPDHTTLSQRVAAKAEETGYGLTKLWTAYRANRDRGLAGLIDMRAVRTRYRNLPVALGNAITAEIAALRDKSNIPMTVVISNVKARVKQERLPATFVMPSEATLRRLVLERVDGQQLQKPAKSRRNAANRPAQAYGHFHAVRPGELVLIDTTPLDMFALDPHNHEWCSIQLTIALDVYTRSLVGWRFSRETTAVDAALLLRDIIRPKRSREWFGTPVGKPFAGIPDKIVAHIDADDDAALEGKLIPIPFLHPESVLVDQGKVYLSEAFLSGCRRLGISLMLARPYTPTDKAHVERMFKTIRESFLARLHGYKGPDVASRGKHPEKDAYHYLHEIDDEFTRWVAEWWQERPHDGLFLPLVPTLELSPNDMLREGIASAGFVHVPADPDLYFELLPVVWRKIHHYGVEAFGLRYDSQALDPFRNEPSSYTEPVMGLWPFREDPRDRSVLHFYNPDLRMWQDIVWTGAGSERRPFDDKMLGYAKELAVGRDGSSPTREKLEAVLSDLSERMMSITEADRAKRRMLAKAMHNADLAD